MACFQVRHLCFTAVLLSVAFSCCTGQGGGSSGGGGGGGGGGSGIGAVVPGTQDSVQIVAQAALCFDNRPVLNGCLKALGINASGTGPNMPPPPGSTAVMCSAPCFGHVTMMMSCVNGIFGNFVSYNPGLMQGVQAVFQMSCGNVNGPGGAAGGGGANAGVGGGSGTTANGGGANAGVGGGSGTTANGGGGGGGMGPTNSMGGGAAAGGGGMGTANSIGGGGMGSSTTNTIGGGAAAGNGTANGGGAIVGAIGSINGTNVSPNAGSRVAVSSPGQPASSADGPTFSLKGVVLVIWAGSCLLLF